MSRNTRNGNRAENEPATHKEDPLITPTEVGRMIGKSHITVLNWIRDGLLAHVRYPDGRFVVRRSVVLKLLRNSAFSEKVASDGNT